MCIFQCLATLLIWCTCLCWVHVKSAHTTSSCVFIDRWPYGRLNYVTALPNKRCHIAQSTKAHPHIQWSIKNLLQCSRWECGKCSWRTKLCELIIFFVSKLASYVDSLGIIFPPGFWASLRWSHRKQPALRHIAFSPLHLFVRSMSVITMVSAFPSHSLLNTAKVILHFSPIQQRALAF